MANGTTDSRAARGRWVPHRHEGSHPAALALGIGLSFAWFVSYFLDPTRSLWLAIDENVFWTLNGSLACCRAWQVVMALANSWLSDVVAALCMIGLYLHFMLGKGRHARDELIAIGVMLTALVIVAFQIGKAIPYQRLSATMVHGEAIRLTQLVPWIPARDSSGDTFPGDHAVVLFICAGVITYYLPRAYAIAAWALAAIFIAPRLVAGAHWLTDDFVGSAAIACVVLSCTFATPLHRLATDWLEGRIRRIRTRRWKSS